MTRANAIAFPFFMDKPTARRIGEILAEGFQRFADDKFCGVKQRCAFSRCQFSGVLCRMNSRSPQNFVRHPITNSREAILQK
jgi:hypothetical protein